MRMGSGNKYIVRGSTLVADFTGGFLVVHLDKIRTMKVIHDKCIYGTLPTASTLRIEYEDGLSCVEGMSPDEATNVGQLIQDSLLDYLSEPNA